MSYDGIGYGDKVKYKPTGKVHLITGRSRGSDGTWFELDREFKVRAETTEYVPPNQNSANLEIIEKWIERLEESQKRIAEQMDRIEKLLMKQGAK